MRLNFIRKNLCGNIFYFFGTIAFISLTFSTLHNVKKISSNDIQSERLINKSRLAKAPNQYEKRRKILQYECKNLGKSSFNTIEIDTILNYLGFVLRSQSLFYCSVPKVATRTLLTYMTYLHIQNELIPSLKSASIQFDINFLYSMFANDDKNDSSLFLSKVLQKIRSNGSRIEFWPLYGRNALPYLRLRTLTNISLLFSSSFIRAIFVRHPLERLASAYADKIGTLKSEPFSLYDMYRRKICRKFASFYLSTKDQLVYYSNESLENQLNEPCAKVIPTFEHFIEYIMQNSSEDHYGDDVHWKPYSSLCKVCQMKYNFIGKYETMQKDMKFFKTKLGLNTTDWNEEVFFSTGKTRKDYKLLYSKLSKDLLCYLKDYYRHDSKLFNYRFEDYLPYQQKLHCLSKWK